MAVHAAAARTTTKPEYSDITGCMIPLAAEVVLGYYAKQRNI